MSTYRLFLPYFYVVPSLCFVFTATLSSTWPCLCTRSELYWRELKHDAVVVAFSTYAFVTVWISIACRLIKTVFFFSFRVSFLGRKLESTSHLAGDFISTVFHSFCWLGNVIVEEKNVLNVCLTSATCFLVCCYWCSGEFHGRRMSHFCTRLGNI